MSTRIYHSPGKKENLPSQAEPISAVAGFHQLQTIPERVKDMHTAAPVDLRIRPGWQPGGLAFRENLVQSFDDQCGVRFPCRAKAFLHPQVHLRRSRGEPATAAAGKRLRLGNLFSCRVFDIEPSCAVFTSFWHGNLYVINA